MAATVIALGLANPPGFLMLYFHHHQPLWRNSWASLRAVLGFVETINILWLEPSPTYFEQCAHHFANHVAQKRPAAHRKHQLFIVRGSYKFRRVNLALR